MRPTVVGLDSWLVFWTLGAGLGTVVNFTLARRNGLPIVRTVLALGAMTLAGLMGAWLQYRVDLGFGLSGLVGSRGTRMAGGVLAVAVVSPLVLSLLRLPIRRVLDLTVFGILVAMTVGRFGCFLRGCCFGTPTSLPWGVSFPSGSLAYQSHRVNHIVSADALASAPVHPLQLYFALTTAAIAIFLLWMSRFASRDGELFAWFMVLQSWATVCLENLRGMDLSAPNNGSGRIDLVVALLVTPVLLVVALPHLRRFRGVTGAGPSVPVARGATTVPPAITSPPPSTGGSLHGDRP